ncbi:MAG: MmgE/PrpD family protein [Parvularculaceae bacterium]
MSGQSPEGPTIVESLAARLARPVNAATRSRAALHVLDWTGCALAGGREAAGAAMRAARARTPEGEAFFLGALGNILEMDDVDKRALLHPGPVVIPAAIAAAAETAGADEFLGAIVRGYEAMIRLGRAVGPGHYRFWHNTATCGPFGAAAAAASLSGFDRVATANTLSFGAAQASGFWQVRHEPLSHVKQLHTARAAEAGVRAARLTGAGLIGIRTIFEGEQGFFAATCPGADAREVIGGGEGWAIEEVSFKPWPACRHAHAVIDAALALRGEGVAPSEIDRVEIETYRDALVFCDRPAPTTTLEAKFSLQHAAAVALLEGEPGLDHFEQRFRDDSRIAALRHRVFPAETAVFTARYPARFGAEVHVTLNDGTRRSAMVADALGDPENPAPLSLIIDKTRRLMKAGGLSGAEAGALSAAALALGEGGDLSEYLGLLRAVLDR